MIGSYKRLYVSRLYSHSSNYVLQMAGFAHVIYDDFIGLLNKPDFNIGKEKIPRPDLSDINDDEKKLWSRMEGSLRGLAVGDAVGGPYEFESRECRKNKPAVKMIVGGSHGLSKGEWTDDTSMALCLAVSLIIKKKCDQYDQLMRYNWWKEAGYLSSRQICFDIGNMTSYSLNKFQSLKKKLLMSDNLSGDSVTDDLKLSDQRKEGVSFDCGSEYTGRKAGNGSLMRLTAVPLFYFGMINEAVKAAQDSSVTTHSDPIAVDACRLYTAMIMAALEGQSKERILEADFYKDYTGNCLDTDIVTNIAKGSYKVNGDVNISGSGYVAHSVEGALWSLYNDECCFEKGVLLAINLGDDTDTTAAIYGQLAGALYGLGGIPREWLDHVVHRDNISCIAAWLYLSNKEVRQRRSIRPS